MDALEKLFDAVRKEALEKNPELKDDEKKLRSAMLEIMKASRTRPEQPLNNENQSMV